MGKVIDKLGREINAGDICTIVKGTDLIIAKINHTQEWNNSLVYTRFSDQQNDLRSLLYEAPLGLRNCKCYTTKAKVFILKRQKNAH